MLTEYINYAKHVNAPAKTAEWLTRRLKKAKATQQQVEHVIDFLASDARHKNWFRSSFKDALTSADKWVKAMNGKAKGIVESKGDTETVKALGSGLKLVKLVGENAFKREGLLMSHCVASYYGKEGTTIYSIRDAKNDPHCTIEVTGKEEVQQIKGKGNGPIHPKYIKAVIKAVEAIGYKVTGSDMKNLGYVDVTRLKTVKVAKSKLFQGKWASRTELDKAKVINGKSKSDYTHDMLELVG